jgi:hypothetical protein
VGVSSSRGAAGRGVDDHVPRSRRTGSTGDLQVGDEAIVVIDQREVDLHTLAHTRIRKVIGTPSRLAAYARRFSNVGKLYCARVF